MSRIDQMQSDMTRIARKLAGIVLPPTMAVGLVAVGCTSSQSDATKTWDLPELSAADGMSFRLPAFEVPAGHEEQSCYFVRVPDLNSSKEFWVNHVKAAMNPGSHHLNVFRVRTIINLGPETGVPIKLGPYDATVVIGHDDYKHSPCWGSANWADWPLVSNTQKADAQHPYTDWQMPDGVALQFTPGEWLMIQSHYVNTTDQPAPNGGRVGINFYRTAQATQELGTLFATQQNIRICQSVPDVTFSGTCRFPGNVTLTAANGHFHKRGEQFRMYSWDGASVVHPPAVSQFYLSENWDSPPMETNINTPVARGGGIWWDCQYHWIPPLDGCDTVNQKDPEQQGDCCYTFGGNTDVGEHCNAFVYYYPRVNNTDIFCN